MSKKIKEPRTDSELNRANIVSLHGTMSFLAQKAGVRKDTWLAYVKDLEQLSFDCLEEMEKFFVTLLSNEWRELHDIRYAPHVSEELWENYKTFGITGQDEQVHFEKAARDFKEAWLKRPKRHKHRD